MRRIGDADDETDLFDEAEAEDLGNDCVSPPKAQITGEPVITNVGAESVEIVNADHVSFPRHGRGLLCDDAEAMAEVSAMAVRTVVNEPEPMQTSQAPPAEFKWPHDRFESLTVDGEPVPRPFVPRRGRGRGFYRGNRMGQNRGEMNEEFHGGPEGSPVEIGRGFRGGRRSGGQRRGRGGQKTSGGLPFYSEHDDRVILKEPVYSDDDRGPASPARNKMVDEDTGQFPPWREEVGTRGAYRGQGQGGVRSRGGGRPNRNYVDDRTFYDQGYSRPPHNHYFESDHPHFYDGGSDFNTMQNFRLRGRYEQRDQRDVYENFSRGEDQRATYNPDTRGRGPRGMYDGFSRGGGRGKRGNHTSAFYD